MSNFKKINQFPVFLTTHEYTQKASHRINGFNIFLIQQTFFFESV